MGSKLQFWGLGIASLLLLIVVAVQVELTELRLQIPKARQELFSVLEDNCQLSVAIDQLENPARLMALAESPQYAHLKYPLAKDVLTLNNE